MVASRVPIESLHKACGSVEVAKDMVERLRAGAAEGPSPELLERLTEATRALGRAVEAIEAHLRGSSLGPAA